MEERLSVDSRWMQACMSVGGKNSSSYLVGGDAWTITTIYDNAPFMYTYQYSHDPGPPPACSPLLSRQPAPQQPLLTRPHVLIQHLALQTDLREEAGCGDAVQIRYQSHYGTPCHYAIAISHAISSARPLE